MKEPFFSFSPFFPFYFILQDMDNYRGSKSNNDDRYIYL